MSKTKYYILGSIFFCLILGIGVVIGLLKSAEAQTTSTTFPVAEAGIAAYVELDSIDIKDLTEALNFFNSVEKKGETFIIGTVKVENGRMFSSYDWGSGRTIYYPAWDDYPHLYIGLDGWMVAYYLRNEETSRIMQWKGYTPGTINTTTLKDAIDLMANNLKVTYLPPIRYYHFGFPKANKLTLVAETANYSTNYKNCFSVTIPGALFEASYSVYTGQSWCNWYCYSYPLSLSVGEVNIFSSPTTSLERYFGYYDTSTLTVNVPHSICLHRYNGGGGATVLIYKAP